MLTSYRIEVLELSSLKKAFFTLLTSDYSLQWYGMLPIHSMKTGGGRNIWEQGLLIVNSNSNINC